MTRPMTRTPPLLATAALLTFTGMLHAQAPAPDRPAKKLIEYGWDVPYPDQLRKDIRNMEKKPFDGVIFRLREWNPRLRPASVERGGSQAAVR